MNSRCPHFIAWFFGAVFLTNFVPHFVAGVSGSAFQSPFADPPGIGLSSSTLNVIWALVNLTLAWVLLRVGSFEWKRVTHFLPFMTGVLLMALFTARHFGKLHGGAL